MLRTLIPVTDPTVQRCADLLTRYLANPRRSRRDVHDRRSETFADAEQQAKLPAPWLEYL